MAPHKLVIAEAEAMTRSVDQNWKRIQETTFTNWINSSFLNKLKTSQKQVQNLQTDLQDGTVLAELLENISMKSVGPYNKNPTIKATKLENLGTCLRFLEKEKVKVVNIGTAPPTVFAQTHLL